MLYGIMKSAVTRRNGIKGGRPVLRGTKLTVPHVARLVYDHKIPRKEIMKIYTNVEDVGMVNAALDYYNVHKEEMEQLEKERDSAVSRLEHRAVND